MRNAQSMVAPSTRKVRPPPKRKDPEKEFFEMTVLAFILSHPSSKSIMTVDRNELFDQCKLTHKSFHEWPNWINQTLTRIVLNEKYNRAHVGQAMRESVLVQSNLERSRKATVNYRDSVMSDSLLIQP